MLSKKVAIADLVSMRTKLMKWSALRQHYTQKVSFSPKGEKSGRKAVKIANFDNFWDFWVQTTPLICFATISYFQQDLFKNLKNCDALPFYRDLLTF